MLGGCSAADSGDDGRDVRVRQDEPQGELGHRLPGRHQRPQRLDPLDRLPQVRRREVGVAPVAVGPSALARQLPGQAPLVQRHARDHGDTQLPAQREQLVLGRLVEHVVDHLDGVDQAGPQRPQHVRGLAPVDADAHVADEPVAPERLHGALPPGVVCPLVLPDVELHQVDGPRPDLPEHPGDRRPDVIRREHVLDPAARQGRPLTVLRRDLRREEQLAVRVRGPQLPHQAIRDAVPVDLGGVEEGDARVHGSLEDDHRGSVVRVAPATDASAHPPHADAELADGAAAAPEGSLAHEVPPRGRARRPARLNGTSEGSLGAASSDEVELEPRDIGPGVACRSPARAPSRPDARDSGRRDRCRRDHRDIGRRVPRSSLRWCVHRQATPTPTSDRSEGLASPNVHIGLTRLAVSRHRDRRTRWQRGHRQPAHGRARRGAGQAEWPRRSGPGHAGTGAPTRCMPVDLVAAVPTSAGRGRRVRTAESIACENGRRACSVIAAGVPRVDAALRPPHDRRGAGSRGVVDATSRPAALARLPLCQLSDSRMSATRAVAGPARRACTC